MKNKMNRKNPRVKPDVCSKKDSHSNVRICYSMYGKYSSKIFLNKGFQTTLFYVYS